MQTVAWTADEKVLASYSRLVFYFLCSSSPHELTPCQFVNKVHLHVSLSMGACSFPLTSFCRPSLSSVKESPTRFIYNLYRHTSCTGELLKISVYSAKPSSCQLHTLARRRCPNILNSAVWFGHFLISEART